jgi:hypothetical protein
LFFANLAAVYFVARFFVMLLAGLAHNVILPLLRMPSEESRFAFAFNYLWFFSLLCGLCAGIVATKYNHRAAWWVWVVPLLILAFKFATFPSSLFEGHFAPAFHHYIAGGFLIPEFHSYREMFAGFNADYTRAWTRIYSRRQFM